MSDSFKSDFLNSTAVIVVKVLAVTIKRGISGGIKARNISGPRVPCSSSFIVLHESLMNRTHCVRKIEVFPLLMGRKPPTFLNSDKFLSPRYLEFNSLELLSLNLPQQILVGLW